MADILGLRYGFRFSSWTLFFSENNINQTVNLDLFYNEGHLLPLFAGSPVLTWKPCPSRAFLPQTVGTASFWEIFFERFHQSAQICTNFQTSLLKMLTAHIYYTHLQVTSAARIFCRGVTGRATSLLLKVSFFSGKLWKDTGFISFGSVTRSIWESRRQFGMTSRRSGQATKCHSKWRRSIWILEGNFVRMDRMLFRSSKNSE